MSKNKRTKKEMSDKTRIILFAVVIVVVIALIGVLAVVILNNTEEEKDKDNPKTNINEIVGYGITIDDLDSETYKKEYEILKSNLESESVDYDAYAESVAKMFLIDLYTLKSKINKYDVGGVELVLPEKKDNYVTNVTDTIYNYVEDNTNGKRNQSLPVVNGVTIKETKKDKYTIKDTKETYDSYVFDIDISYVQDLSYDKRAEVIVIKKDKFMYVVEKN